MKTLRVCPDNVRHVRQESLACGNASQSRETLRVSDDDVRAVGFAAGVTVRSKSTCAICLQANKR
jgi:hypothetical protein